MITISTLFIIIYALSIYKIRIESGSWEKFEPHCAGGFFGAIFVFGTLVIAILFSFIVFLLIEKNIIP